MLPLVLLAGGLATRLRPITEKIPKALVEVAGRPFIEWQLEELARQGIDQVVLCTGYLGDQIQAVVGNGERLGLAVRYSPDGPVLLGTGGAVRQALPMLGERFFVLYGDSFLPIDYAAVEQAFSESGYPALMTVLHNNDRWDKSNVHFEKGRLLRYDKQNPTSEMQYIDYGLGVLTVDVLNKYAADVPFDLAEIYRDVSLEGRLAGFEVHERFYEIGSHQGLRETESYFLKRIHA
jgi:NDP-sugar pyrophosphorylase family protein